MFPHDERVRSLAFMRAALNVGFTLGAAIGGLALAFDSDAVIRAVPWFTAGDPRAQRRTDHPAAEGSARHAPRRAPVEKALKSGALRNRGFVLLNVFDGVLGTNQVLLNVVIPLWLVQETDAPHVLLAWLFGTNTVLAVLLQVPAAHGRELGRRPRCARRGSAPAFFVLSCLIVLVTHDTLGWTTIVLVWLGHVTVTGAELFQSAGNWGFLSELSDPSDAASTRAPPTSAAPSAASGRRRCTRSSRSTWGTPGWLLIAAIIVVAVALHGTDLPGGGAVPDAQRAARDCLNRRSWHLLLSGSPARDPARSPQRSPRCSPASGVAAYVDSFVWWKALLALVVSLALQVAVNYANDYSDGIRGTDADRVGPMRLVGSGAASPGGGEAGRVPRVRRRRRRRAWCSPPPPRGGCSPSGVVSVLAAWFYTGGSKPYGYLGLGEVMVFVFFGLVAVIGTTYVQTETWEWAALYAAVGIGALACAILVANNLRDIPTDTVAGKRTLAVVLGDRRTRLLYVVLVAVATIAVAFVAAVTTWCALAGYGFLVLALPGCRTVLSGATGPGLIPVLQTTGLAELAWAVLVTAALLVGR